MTKLNRAFDAAVKGLGGGYAYKKNRRPFTLFDRRSLSPRNLKLLKRLVVEVIEDNGKHYESDKEAEHDGVFVLNCPRKKQNKRDEVRINSQFTATEIKRLKKLAAY